MSAGPVSAFLATILSIMCWQWRHNMDEQHKKMGPDDRSLPNASSEIDDEQHDQLEQLLNSKIHKFVLTGGPCSGKTTAMEKLQGFLRERGFRVFVVPEAATVLFLNGASPDDFKKDGCAYAFQQFVIKTQMSLEDSFCNYARSTGQNSVVLCDRGVMDGQAYVTDDVWRTVLQSVGTDTVSVREGRYNAVFHLVTAAAGAEMWYTLDNNKARFESPEEARVLDEKTKHAWMGHPRHFIIDNTKKNFEQKMQQLVNLVAKTVGLPSTANNVRKYFFNKVPPVHLLENVQTFEVEKIILRVADNSLLPENESENTDLSKTPNSANIGRVLYSFIRKRSQKGFHAYGLTTVKILACGQKVELKQVISASVYALLASSSADKSRNIVRQKRYCFFYEQQSMYICQYLAPTEGLWTLVCQCEGDPILPPILIDSELTVVPDNDDNKSSYFLSRKSVNKNTI